MSSLSPQRRLPPMIGIAGWKNTGKTTVAVRLIEAFCARGLSVASVKHAHHDFQIDAEETDSARHRRAGSKQVAIVSAARWAVVTELGDAPEPALEHVVAKLAPCDVVVVEGYKAASIPKIEVRRRQPAQRQPPPLEAGHIIAIVADHEVQDTALPVFAHDDVAALAEFIERSIGPIGITDDAG